MPSVLIYHLRIHINSAHLLNFGVYGGIVSLFCYFINNGYADYVILGLFREKNFTVYFTYVPLSFWFILNGPPKKD
jgi:hypothetical protein